MDRLRSELERLYLPRDDGRVRALALELLRPAGWQEVARVWQGVQADLGLPPPAIAVSGSDAYQLWFSLAQGVEAQRVEGFVRALQARYLREVPAERVRVQPAQGVPAQVAPERWSAFIAADLAPLFADERWLDHPPGSDAQADLLARLQCIAPEAFERASLQLAPRAHDAQPAEASAAATDASEPRGFLLSVMRDPAVDMRLRIEAAKALLSFSRDTHS